MMEEKIRRTFALTAQDVRNIGAIRAANSQNTTDSAALRDAIKFSVALASYPPGTIANAIWLHKTIMEGINSGHSLFYEGGKVKGPTEMRIPPSLLFNPPSSHLKMPSGQGIIRVSEVRRSFEFAAGDKAAFKALKEQYGVKTDVAVLHRALEFAAEFVPYSLDNIQKALTLHAAINRSVPKDGLFYSSKPDNVDRTEIILPPCDLIPA